MRHKSLPLLIVLGVIFGGFCEKYIRHSIAHSSDFENVEEIREEAAQDPTIPQKVAHKTKEVESEVITSKTVLVKGPKHLRNSLYFLTTSQSEKVCKLLKKFHVSPSKGHRLFFSLKKKNNKTTVDTLHYYLEDCYIEVKVDEDITASKMTIKREMRCLKGQISNSFYHAALKLGAPSNVIANCVMGLKQQNSFFKKGVAFAVIYDVVKMPNGYEAAPCLKYIEFQKKNKPVKLYFFEHKHGQNDFFDEKGFLLQKRAFQKPLRVRHARISSGFGWRIHPITGQRMFHQGVDFDAPRGTHISPAAPGRVIFAGWKGGYGRCVDVSHGNGFVTRYGHMSVILVKTGMSVNMNMSLGTVGSSGIATGPHLHFEIHERGHPINPKRQIYMPQTKLYGAEYKRFCALKRDVQSCLAQSV